MEHKHNELQEFKDRDNSNKVHEIFIHNEFAQCYEVKNKAVPNENGLRIYCDQYPDVFCVQVRTHKPITNNHKGKPRNMIAHLSLSIADVEKVLAFMKGYSKKA